MLAALALLLGATALSAFVVQRSLPWIDARTPGFFVDPTRHISLLSLPAWPRPDAPWPSAVTRVDGTDVQRPDQVYQLVRGKPDGEPISYETSRLGVAGPGFAANARDLTRGEYAALFLAIVGNGLLAIILATLVWRNRPDSEAASALLIAALATGTLAITSVAVVADGSLARVNIFAQSAAAAGILHLALMFPAKLVHGAKTAAMFAVYTPFAALALIYQLTWPDSYGSGLLHATASTAIIVAVLLLLAGMILRLAPRQPIVVRRRAALGLCGVAAVAATSVAWAAMTQFEWRAVSAAIFTTGTLVPLAIGSAIAAADFFALDKRLRAVVAYSAAIAVVVLLYLGALRLISPHLLESGQAFAATLPFALTNLLLLFALAPIIRIVRAGVDRFYSPRTYSAERSISHLNQGLSTARTTQTLVANTIEILKRTLGARKVTVLLRGRGAGFPLFAYDDPDERRIAVPAELAERLESGEDAIRYHWDDGSGSAVPNLLDRLDFDLLMPVYRGGSCVGVIALSGKESRRPYDARDIAFIRTAANQIALALPNAAAQDKLDVLYKNLDELTESLRVQTNRTETLKAMNSELGQALNKLRDTHLQLGENHRAILRAERLAALNRLSIGLTQEISRPLAAVLSSLQGIARVGGAHVGGARTPEKQAAAIDEMVSHAQSGAAWLERAISYLRSFQALGRGAAAGRDESFAVRDAFSEVTKLLRQRRRDSTCKVEYSETPAALEIYGSRQRCALILVDLVSAAMQAYADNQKTNGHISVEAELTSEGVCVRVIDWAGGLAAAAVPRLLEQLGDDDVVGNRRGLWMAKNLVEEGFGGSLEAFTNDERTCFTAIFPNLAQQRGPLVPPPTMQRAANDATR